MWAVSALVRSISASASGTPLGPAIIPPTTPCVVDWARRDETKRAEIKSVAAMPENANFLEIVAQRAPHCGMALTPEYRSRLRVYGVFTKGAAAQRWHFTQLFD